VTEKNKLSADNIAIQFLKIPAMWRKITKDGKWDIFRVHCAIPWTGLDTSLLNTTDSLQILQGFTSQNYITWRHWRVGADSLIFLVHNVNH